MSDEIEKLKARATREKNARKEAERILEQKSVELYHSNIELKELTKNLELRVAERTAELQMAHDEALKLAEVKSEFLANMSHELRTPLNGVLGMLTLLQNTELTQNQTKLINTAVNSGELLLALINDVLDLSKLENDKLELEVIPFEPGELIQLTCEPFVSQASAKSVDLIYLIAPDMPLALKGDPTRIKQIITNLVSNALKFTEQGEILVSAHYEDGEYVIAISDTGIGMTPEQLDKALDKFSQANESTTRKFGGTGLGLAICKKLIDAMEGLLSISSEVNVGSCFEVRLPIKKQQGEAELIYPTGLENKRFLIAFNNFHLLHHMESLLLFWNIHQITKASNPEDFQQMLSEQEFDLVILDQRLSHNACFDPISLTRSSQQACQIISYWPVGTTTQNEIDHNMLILPIKQSDLYDALVQSPDCGLSSDISKDFLPTQIRFNNANILLVEDNLVNQEVARELLSLFGCNVTIANNGEEAVHKVQQQEFDLILMDIQMPVMDGITATKAIRTLGSPIPIIALTAHSLQGDRDKSINAGMNDHITKPIELNELARVLTDFLQDKKQILSIAEQTTKNQQSQLDEASSDTEAIKHYPGLNHASAMDRVLNNMALYHRILKEFAKSTRMNMELIESGLNKQTYEEATRAVHTIKGSAANVGADQVMQDAAELEFLLKSGSGYDFSKSQLQSISELYQVLKLSCDVIFSSIEKYLADQNLDENEDNSEQQIQLSKDQIMETVTSIQQSLYTNIAEVDDLISQLENAKIAKLSKYVEHLRTSYQTFNYEQIEAACEQIINKA